MIVLLDTSDNLDVAATELGCKVGQLLTPKRPTLHDEVAGKPWAIDNGAYSGLDVPAYLRLLDRYRDRQTECVFVVAPDVVGSARRTLEVFDRWTARLRSWPIALALQDGQEDLPIPWDEIRAVFLGGTTEWKMSRSAASCVQAAKALEKWVHIGRVNTPGRYEYFADMGADSCDGSGLARYSHMRRDIWLAAREPRLPLTVAT
jgi:hypothetical protein